MQDKWQHYYYNIIIVIQWWAREWEKTWFDEKSLTWWQFWLEHIHGYDVYDQHPYRAFQHVLFVLDEADSTQTLTFQTPAVRVRSAQFSGDVLLEFFHVKKLKRKKDQMIIIKHPEIGRSKEYALYAAGRSFIIYYYYIQRILKSRIIVLCLL